MNIQNFTADVYEYKNLKVIPNYFTFNNGDILSLADPDDEQIKQYNTRNVYLMYNDDKWVYFAVLFYRNIVYGKKFIFSKNTSLNKDLTTIGKNLNRLIFEIFNVSIDNQNFIGVYGYDTRKFIMLYTLEDYEKVSREKYIPIKNTLVCATCPTCAVCSSTDYYLVPFYITLSIAIVLLIVIIILLVNRYKKMNL